MTSPQPALFDPATTTPQTCPIAHCHAVRQPGQQGPVTACGHDLDPDYRRRPRGCLNAYNPQTAPIPY